MTLVVPAVDLLDGNVVRLEQGDLKRSNVYSNDPIKVVKEFAENGASLIHLVDLNAAVRSDPMRNEMTINAILQNVNNSKFQIAGGIRSVETAISLISKGAGRIVLGSVAYLSLETALKILESIGSSKTVLALDYDREGRVKTHGWKKNENETTSKALARFSKLGFEIFLLTSIDRDGLMTGPDLAALKEFKNIAGSNCEIIASGGVATVEDLTRLAEISIDEAIVGKSFYERKIPLSILKHGGRIN